MVAGTVTLGSIVILLPTRLPPKTMIRSILDVEVTVLSTWPLTVTTIDSPLADVASGISDTSILFVICEHHAWGRG